MVLNLLYLICFLDIFSFALFLPVASVHVLSIGGSRFLLGLLASLHALLQLLSGPLVGSWSDSIGRKTLLLNSFLLCSISNLMLTSSSSLTTYIISRIILGTSCHVQILAKALITDNVLKEDQNAVFGKIGALMGISFIIGPVLGGFLNTFDNGFFYISLILSASSLAGVGVAFLLPNVGPLSPKKDKIQKSLATELSAAFINLKNVKWDIFWDIFTFKFLVESSFSAFFSTFGIIVMDLYGASQQQMALVLSLFSTLAVISNLSFAKLKQVFYSDDMQGFKRNLHGFIGMTLVFTTAYLGASFPTYILIMGPLAFTRVLLDATWTEMLLSRTKESDKGTIMGSYESIVQVSSLATPLITGIVGHVWGYAVTPSISIIPVLTGCLLANYCYRKSLVRNDKED